MIEFHQKTRYEKEQEAWKKDPNNPDNILKTFFENHQNELLRGDAKVVVAPIKYSVDIEKINEKIKNIESIKDSIEDLFSNLEKRLI
jgi:hypothetical protein